MQHIQMEIEKKKNLNSTHTHAHEIMQHHMEFQTLAHKHTSKCKFLFFPSFMHLI
jgi:hypothetical protein